MTDRTPDPADELVAVTEELGLYFDEYGDSNYPVDWQGRSPRCSICSACHPDDSCDPHCHICWPTGVSPGDTG